MTRETYDLLIKYHGTRNDIPPRGEYSKCDDLSIDLITGKLSSRSHFKASLKWIT